MGAAESLSRAVGYGGWSVVMLGVACVMMAVMLGGRRRCGRLTVPAEVAGQEREQMRHSQVYVAPPHRKNYRSNQRRM